MSEPMKLRSPILKSIFLLIAFIAASLQAQDGLLGAVSKSGNSAVSMHSSLESKLAAADFDNDQKPDGALLLDVGMVDGQQMYRVELHLSAGANDDLVFAASDPALTISAQDVNQDGTPDLVVEQTFTHKRVRVWLNDGHGAFRQARVEDFPVVPDTPLHWTAPSWEPAYLVVGLPSRFETHDAAQLLEILRFDSSSSHWMVRRVERSRIKIRSTSDSPRAPPTSLPL